MASSALFLIFLVAALFQVPTSANEIPTIERICNIIVGLCTEPGKSKLFMGLNEELPIDTVFANFTAHDKENADITFGLAGNSDAVVFFKIQKINSKTSSLMIKSRIDRESFRESIITAEVKFDDGVNTPSKLYLFITIEDTNDNAPLFMRQPYRCLVYENLLTANCSGIEVWDKDTDRKQPTVTISGTNFDPSSFAMVPLDRGTESRGIGMSWNFNLAILKPLDYEKDRIFQFQITAKDAAGLNTTADFFLSVRDQPDQPPVFLRQPYDRSVNENSRPGTPVVQIFAQDGDGGINNPIRYLLVDGKFINFFNIDNSTGKITVAKEIDRESDDVRKENGFIELTVKAEEISTPAQLPNVSVSSVVVHLTVVDTNDYVPRFGASEYFGTIAENTQKGVAVSLSPEITCTDLDQGSNGFFNLSVMDGANVSEVFSILPTDVVQMATARLRVKKPSVIDYELPKKQFVIQVLAQETSPPFKTATAIVTLNVTDVNDNFPTFNQSTYTFRVDENSPINTFVGQVIATDEDSGKYGQVTYSQTSSTKFSINSTTGEIRVTVPADTNYNLLDRDNFASASYSLNVRAVDGGNLMAYAQVFIHLIDVNDNSPIFLPTNVYFGTLVEESMTFSRSVQVSATDRDAAPANGILYSITAGNYGNHFAIDGSSGVISVATKVDLEKLPPELNNSNVFNLTVQATDKGTPPQSSLAFVILQVEDINDNDPVFNQSSYAKTIPETTPFNTQVLQVSAEDADRSGRVFYRIGGGAADKFAIDGVKGSIRVDTRNDLEVKTYNITVLAVDRGTPSRSSETLVSVTVKDVNNKAPFFRSTLYTKVIEENNEANSPIVTYPATDPDSSAKLVYTILKDQMSAKNGLIPLPAYLYQNAFTITEAGTLIAKIKLNREVMDTVSIPILVNDTNAETAVPIQTASTTISLIIEDVNDESPRFQFSNGTTSFSLRVLESLSPPADTSLTVQAVDGDKNDVIRYALDDSTGHFSIDGKSGLVRLLKELDFEKNQTLELKVKAVDTFGHMTTGNITVQVIDVNDNSPNFTQFESPVRVLENRSVDSVVTTVKATDEDSGPYGHVNYFLTSNGGGRFQINATTGVVILKRTLDRDVAGGTSFRLAVEARDNVGGRGSQGKASKLMEIIVMDVNDNRPIFAKTLYNITTLKENVEIGTKVDEIAATDADDGDNAKIIYQLRSSPAGSDTALALFEVTTVDNRAIIRTAKSLKNQVGCHLTLLVAEDQGDPKKESNTSLSICVLDVNDAAPRFEHPTGPSKVLFLDENKANVTLIVVKAVDSDKGVNGMVRYRLEATNDHDKNFTIDSVTGALSNPVALDREVQAVYQFSVVAYDKGDIPLSSAVAIQVNIRDADDHPPIFPASKRLQTLTVPENNALNEELPTGAKGSYIGNVGGAIDLDTEINAVICFFIVSAAHRDMFYLNKSHHKLYVLQELDRESKTEYTLTIKAVGKDECDTDNYVWAPATTRRRLLYLTSEIPYSASDATLAQVKVIVGDDNDNRPYFDRKSFFNGVTKDSQPLTEIINFMNFVTDKDTGNNSRLEFSVKGAISITEPLKSQLKEKGLTDPIVLNPSTGLLTTGPKVYFQANMRGYFVFQVRAHDGKYDAFADVTVYLLSQSQRVVVVFRDSPANVGKLRKTFADYLSNITGLSVNVDSIVTHKRDDGQADSRMTDMYIHAYNPRTNKIISAADLIRMLDVKWKSLQTLYNTYNVIIVREAEKEEAPTSLTDIFRIALILVACVLSILVIITCIALWTCRRMYRRKLRAAQTPVYGNRNGFDHTTQVPGTNQHCYEGSNPIWMAEYNNLAMNHDTTSEKDRDSLDENALMQKQPIADTDEQEVILDLPEETDTDMATTNGVRDHELLDAALNKMANKQPASSEPGSMVVNGYIATAI